MSIRIHFLFLALVVGGLLLVSKGFASESRQGLPNILMIMVDDLGWHDLACQGNPLVETPHLDRLAAQGIRFTDAYAAAPVCSPTRAAVMTGKYPARLRITNHIPDRAQFIPNNATLNPAKMLDHLPLDEVTIAERLRDLGYRTAFMGKWHLSGSGAGEDRWQPDRQGFDLNIGGCGFGGPPTFFDPYRIPTLTNRRRGEYLPDRLADEAIQFIRSDDARPFALFLWNYSVHWPMEAPEGLLNKYKDRTGPGLNDTRYGAMIEALDSALGRVISALDQRGIADQTLVIFTSDNGGFSGVSDNRPLRESKGYLYEGGIRVPLIFRWTGKIKPGQVTDAVAISTDFFPTILDAAGQADSLDSQDGVSLLPHLLEGKPLDRSTVFFHYPNYAFHRSNRLGSAIRQGPFKLIEYFDDQSVELYNLKDDLSETRNLATQQPELADRLRQELHAWRDDVNAALPTPRSPGPNP